MALGFKYLISSRQFSIQSHSRNYLPVLVGSNQQPKATGIVQHSALNPHLAPHLATWQHISSSHLATWQRRSAPSYSGTFHLGHIRKICAGRNYHFHHDFNGKSNEYSQTRETFHPNLVKHLSHLLAGVGLSYIIYRVGAHIQDQCDILPVANCSSQETQVTPLEGQPTQKSGCSSKKFRRKAEKAQTVVGDSGNQRITLQAAVETAQKLCKRRKEEVGSPGIAVCVSVDGKQVYAEGFGYSDVENAIPMKPCSVLRIASISKAITATIVAKAWEEGHLDIEKSVHHYVPSFPQKEFMGEKVEISVQQLLSHTSGIRHYKSKDDPVYAFDKPIADLVGLMKNASWQPFYKTGPLLENTISKDSEGGKEDGKGNSKKVEVSEMERDEYYITKHFSTTTDSLALFAQDPLVARPGTRHIYTTFGYTLLAAVIEAALKSPFTSVVTNTLGQMGLAETYLDLNDRIIYNRAQYYVKDANGKIVNAPYVDNSYKWAGGGLLSTSEDIVKFGNILLYSAQHQDGDPGPPGFLKSSTMWKFWSTEGVKGAKRTYGLGFSIRPASEQFGMCDHKGFGAGHTGAAIGVSSALFILPRQNTSTTYGTLKNSNSHLKDSRDKSALPAAKNTSTPAKASCEAKCSSSNITEDISSVREKSVCEKSRQSVAGPLPQGVVVGIILNMVSVSAGDIAEDIAKTFEKIDFTL
ncbi:hypothetical protein BsWGS_17181 [Bradybaena similaris]